MLAKAVGQSRMYRLTLRIREQARSHLWFCSVAYDAISWRHAVEAQAFKGARPVLAVVVLVLLWKWLFG